MDRRLFSTGLMACLSGVATLAHAGDKAELSQRFAEIEKASGARLGISVLDTGSRIRAGHREDERFPMCSTFKFLAATAILARVDQQKERLDRRVVFSQRDLVDYSPVTEKHVGSAGMTVAEICEAAITRSDNTAGNLMLASIGGPAGLTRYTRSLGDKRTRLDRTETALNEARPGDPRDTTTPAAMLGDMQKILLGDALSQPSRAQLLRWLDANQTGGQRLRAGVPADWVVGDKTGSGDRGTANVIAILRPPGRGPILAAVYLTQSTASMEARNATIASVGAAFAKAA
ncbi:class A beta-lactamase [Variovorax sp. J22P240]|uniref:class A beta-lactamase n=1 Tax=Variovorax sp. J22P240 TaxID=3053514 RepID=UPI002575FF12|nr:class A beta-lactamase [Variovorax sp. J22P240]MDL9997695.1 class A beta-lactamase [Variovorax sp. J22P240]